MWQRETVIVGERHGRPESTRLFLDLVKVAAERSPCPVVGLEIGMDQQPTLDALVRGEGTADAVRVFWVIDHPGYRDLLAELAHLAHGSCMEVLAIDSAPDVAESRDARMAARLAPYIGRRPVLVLVGRIHALRRIAWDAGAKAERPLAEHLAAQGGRDTVVSVLQDWPRPCDGPPSPRLVPVDSAQGAQAISTTFRVLAAAPPADPREAADFVVVWECDAPK